ncbi:MAG: Peptide synthetase [Pseudomonadota bacterium]|nr:Peptide synthetase [Pseudomonadota bacterium]
MYKIKLSPYHKIFYNEWKIDPNSCRYNIIFDQTFSQTLDISRLNNALYRFIYEHLIFNSHVKEIDGELYWIKNEFISRLESFDSNHYNQQNLYKYVSSQFDIEKQPLYRAAAFKKQNGEYRLIIILHHILIDGNSFDEFITIISKYYNDELHKSLINLDIQLEIIRATTDKLENLLEVNYLQHKQFWSNLLLGIEGIDLRFLRLGTYKQAQGLDSDKYNPIKESKFSFSESDTRKINAISNKYGLTPYLYSQFIFALLLYRYTSQDKFAIAYPIVIKEGHTLLNGAQINSNFIVYDFTRDITVVELFSQLSSFFKFLRKGNLKYGYYPVYKIIENGNKDILNTVFAQTNLKNTKFDFTGTETLSVNNEFNIDLPNKFTFEQENKNNQLNCRIRYNTAEIDEELLSAFVNHYKMLFMNILADLEHNITDKLLIDYQILDPKEYNKIVYEWNQTEQIYPDNKTIHQLFEEQVIKTPDNIAVVYENNQLTYSELNKKANQLAHYINHICQIMPEDLVALCLNRNEYILISIFAVLKCGAAYVPIDPDDPIDRIKYILTDTKTKALLTNDNIARVIYPIYANDFNIHKIVIDEQNVQNGLNVQPDRNLKNKSASNSLAYVVYTSGTTGNPKGVMIEHKSIINYVTYLIKDNQLDESSVGSQYAGFGFDALVIEIYPIVLSGAKLCIIKQDDKMSPTKINEFFMRHKVTYAFLPTQMAQMFFDVHNVGLKNLIVGGDKLKAFSRQNYRIMNAYGPTEATVQTNSFIVDKFYNNIPIGKPIYNVTNYVLDANLNPLPIGAIGELHIGGVGIARGYLNLPQLTKERFILNKFQDKAYVLSGDNNHLIDKFAGLYNRIYRTGDMVRWLPDGNIEYIGRYDSQINMNGYRIELDEIKSRLLGYPGIKDAIVIADISNAKVCSSVILIIAYYVAEVQLNETDILDYLSTKLPYYMLPSSINYLTSIPLTSNGKLNKLLLPKPYLISVNYKAPQNKLQQLLVDIWSEILHIPTKKIGILDNFFKLGGNSILGIKFLNILNQRISADIQIKDMFSHNTIENLCYLISNTQKQSIYKNYIIKGTNFRNLYKPFNLSNIQQAYYFGRLRNSLKENNFSAHLYMEYKLIDINVLQLEKAINKLICRHLSLRTIFISGKQHYLKKYPYYKVNYYEFSFFSELEALRSEYSHKCYEVGKLWLFDILVSKLDNQYIFHFSVDGLIMDASSMQIFFDELTKLYNNLNYELPNLKINYRDYIIQYNKIRNSDLYTKAEKYWVSKLDEYNFELNLPLKGALNLNTTPSSKFVRITKELDSAIWNKVTLKTTSYGISQTALLLCVYGHILSYWSNQIKVCINLTLFNRLPLHEQITKIIGDFTVLDIFNYINIVDKNYIIADIFRINHNKLWEDIEHSLFDGIDFQRLVREKLSLSGKEIIAPVVLTSLLGFNFADETILNDSCRGINYSITQTPQVWIDNKAYEKNGKFVAEWDYVEELFDKNVLEAMHKHYCDFIEYLSTADWDKDVFINLAIPTPDADIIESANADTTEIKYHNTLFSCYEEAVRSYSQDSIAVVDCNFNNKLYTHKQIINDSNILAKYIVFKSIEMNHCLATQGEYSQLIGILSEKGYNQVIGTLAIMKSGFGYVPFNIEWPILRIVEILKHSKIKILLISARLFNNKNLKKALETVCNLIKLECIVDIFNGDVTNQLSHIKLPRVKDSDIAYVIYTSGTTGKPKGVTISHSGALNTILAVNNKFKISDKDSVLALSDISFDLSVFDIFGLLIAGGKIVFPSQDKLKIPSYWLTLIHDYKITIWNTVPQLAELLINSEVNSDLYIAYLRLFLLSGDWIPVTLPELIKEYYPKAKVVSLGGATEGSIWSIWYSINNVEPYWSSIPYGKAMPNQKIYILNYDKKHCPIGVEGDIYIGGVGVALNYWQDNAKTTTSFINHPNLGRLYKTGDIGRWNKNGYIEFMGRIDNQVKLNGYRVEIGEIENVLSNYSTIKQAVVLLKSSQKTFIKKKSGNQFLIGYYVAKDTIDKTELSVYLAQYLPDYMIPSQFIHLDKLPLTLNNKLDREKLLNLDVINEYEYSQPKNEQELLICKSFAKVLEIDEVGADDDLFILGGNSLSVIKVVGVLQTHFDVKISDVFNYRTPKLLAQNINFCKNFIQKQLLQVKLLYQNIRNKAHNPNLIMADNSYQVIKYDIDLRISNVLLTGATGFLGCNILNQLLISTDYNIVLLIRASSQREAVERINMKFKFYFDKNLENLYNTRLSILKSDIEQKDLELSSIEYQNLIQNVDAVIHSAALVKHYGEYKKFHSANVQATVNLLELARLTKWKIFHYISTYAVLNFCKKLNSATHIVTEDDLPDQLLENSNVYVRTKLEGEKEVIKYRQYGLNTNIYRCGNLAFISENYRAQENIQDNAFFNWTKYILNIGQIANEISHVEISPADLTAQAIIKLFNKKTLYNATYHVFNPYLFCIKEDSVKFKEISLKIVDMDGFINFLINNFNTIDYECCIKFLMYNCWLDSSIIENINNIQISQIKTQFILKLLNFEWVSLSNEIFNKYLNTNYTI